jgi:hypothetical protein
MKSRAETRGRKTGAVSQGGDNEGSGRGNRKEGPEGGFMKQIYQGEEDGKIEIDSKVTSLKNGGRNIGGGSSFRG